MRSIRWRERKPLWRGVAGGRRIQRPLPAVRCDRVNGWRERLSRGVPDLKYELEAVVPRVFRAIRVRAVNRADDR